MGLAEDSTQITFTCSKKEREIWSEEALEEGFSSRSKYLYVLIQEARVYRKHGTLADRSSEERIEELEAQVESMKRRLENEQGEPRFRRELSDPGYLELVLEETYKTLPEVLEEVVECGVLDNRVRKEIESGLYVMAGKNQVEYEPGWGWRLTDDTC
ncbi:hypothetical protein C492_11840 [Natronococcus jeotgali DSM 18795]|uniref:Uncharacterized protein n=2 Tax=Natronococcus jeotgali TaxID=413812 RepID=L9X9Y6_9EURY|nr:hypothetical protein C492_11840 [Natronococcus jeotgali DSM 18795]